MRVARFLAQSRGETYENVVALQVAVDDALGRARVQVVHAGGDLARPLEDAVRVDRLGLLAGAGPHARMRLGNLCGRRAADATRKQGTYVAQKLVERAQLGVLDDQVRVDLGGADALELHHVAVAQLAVPPGS